MTDTLSPPVGRAITPFGSFPAAQFTITADPVLIRRAAEPFRRFTTVARDAALALESLQIESWLGAEGDLYRQRRASFAPMLATAQTSHTEAVTYLLRFADSVEALQRRMQTLRVSAEAAWNAGSASPHIGVAEPDAFDPGISQQWLGLLRDARALQAEFESAAAATAAAIAAIPPPPAIPQISALSSSAEAHAAMPPTVTRRVSGELEISAVVSSLLGKAGIKVELEELDNGRVRVRIFDSVGAGAATGSGGGGSISTGKGKMGAEAGAEAEASASVAAGYIAEMDRDELDGFLAEMLDEEASVPSGTGKESVTGAFVEAKVEGSASADASVAAVGEAGASVEAEGSLRGEFMTDGSSVITLTGAGSAEIKGQIGPTMSPSIEKLPSKGGWSIDELTGADDTMAAQAAAAGVALAGAVTLRTQADGSATLERTVRTQRPGDERIYEEQKIHHISHEEAAAIAQDIHDKDFLGAADKLKDIAEDSSTGGPDPDTETHQLVYEVEGEEEFGVEGSAAAGAKTSAGVSVEYREEKLVSKDGVPQ